MFVEARLSCGHRCSRQRFLSIAVAFLCGVLVCWTVLLWMWKVNFMAFVFELPENERLLELGKVSKNSDVDRETKEKFRSLYFVHSPAGQAVAWKAVVFDIRPLSMSDRLTGRTAFRGEAGNELEVLVLDIVHVGGDVYRTGFTPSFGGEYKITVLLTYMNGEHLNYSSHVTAKVINIQGSPFVVTVESRAPPEGITRYCTQSESGVARGRWVRCGTLRGIERCGAWQLNAMYDFDKRHGFHWLPYACQLRHYTNHEMKTCLARNAWEKIVFTGDSHSRYRAYHWVTRLYGKCVGCGKTHVATRFDFVPKMEWVFDARGTRWPASFPSITRPTEIYINSRTRRSLFSDPLPASTDDGDLFLLNFGHWLLREVSFAGFMTAKLRAFVDAVKLRGNSSTARGARKPRFLWVNTMSLKWREDENVRNWTMTPSPSIIAHVNSFVDRAMKDGGIQVVDAFQISNARLNAAHDGTHYAKLFPDAVCAGAVENAVTNVILNALCNDNR